MGIAEYFETFNKQLRLSDEKEALKSKRFHVITKRLNQDFYGSDSDTTHSFYTGSHGRGTDIYTSDIDMVFILPNAEFYRYNSYSGNGQSSLLQMVRNSIKTTYPNTEIGGDGQVVVVEFSNGMKFEIVPSFKLDGGKEELTYPDSNEGGFWRKMNPKDEIYVFQGADILSNYNLKRLCRMIREWNKTNYVFLPGALIDVMCFRFLEKYHYKDKSFLYYDYFTRDFMKYLIDNHEQEYWVMPISNWHVHRKYSFLSEANRAYNDALAAIEAYNKNQVYTAKKHWRNIYGSKFPD